MKKSLLIIVAGAMFLPAYAFAACETVYIVNQGYQTICFADPLPAPRPPCIPAAGETGGC